MSQSWMTGARMTAASLAFLCHSVRPIWCLTVCLADEQGERVTSQSWMTAASLVFFFVMGFGLPSGILEVALALPNSRCVLCNISDYVMPCVTKVCTRCCHAVRLEMYNARFPHCTMAELYYSCHKLLFYNVIAISSKGYQFVASEKHQRPACSRLRDRDCSDKRLIVMTKAVRSVLRVSPDGLKLYD